MTSEQRKYFDIVFGRPVHLASDIKEAVKEHRKANKGSILTKSTVKYADDRILVDGDPMFLSEHSPSTLKFVTSNYYVEFYKALYHAARILKVSSIYKGKIEHNGFELLDCKRTREYTDDEWFQVENNIASTMSKAEYARLVIDAVYCQLGSSHYGDWGRSYNSALYWYSHKELVDHFADKLLVDVPSNFDYNTIKPKSDIDLSDHILFYLGEKYRDAVIEKLRRVTIDNPVLYLVSYRTDREDVRVILDIIAKLKGN